jgi:hypothetical protein
MGTAADPVLDRAVGSPDRAAVLVDALATQQRVLARAQARLAELMVEFTKTRRAADAQRIGDPATLERPARYEPGEFAYIEIGLAVRASRHGVQQVVAVARRLQAETPDAYDAWLAGDIDQSRAVKINHALLRLTKDSSKQLLNATVVDVAVCKTTELLGRWLNQFVAAVEPDQTDERLRRSLDDRYVSVRPDLDGISYLSAAVSSIDATAVDQVLTALAAASAPDDRRTLQQRRADALVDVLLGRVSNGCHLSWTDDSDPDTASATADENPAGNNPQSWGGRAGNDDDNDIGKCDRDRDGGGDGNGNGEWDAKDWGRPASAFRSHPADCETDDSINSDTADHAADADHPARSAHPDQVATSPASSAITGTGTGTGRTVITPCPGDHRPNPIPAVIGVIVTAQSLLGLTDTPGQLLDRSALVPAATIRALAQQPGTLFHRLLTDDSGNLLAVTELGRFPSRKLGLAVRFRDGVCIGPTCHTPATRSDLDHIIPVPGGPTSATNLGSECRTEHRAKTHAGHHVTRMDQNTTEWTTPTGHTYLNRNQPLPVDTWPDLRQCEPDLTPGEGDP